MADKKTPDEGYAAVGEELTRQQGLPAEDVDGEAPQPVAQPVAEDPTDDAIYDDPAEISDVEQPISDPPVPQGEYDSFANIEGEPAAPYLAMDGGVTPVPPVDMVIEEEDPFKPLPKDKSARVSPKKVVNGVTHSPVWQPIVRPVLALVAICIVTSLLLGLTNELTAPIIAANTAAAAEEARVALLPEADGFEQLEVPGDLSQVTAIYRATNDVGWVIEAYGRGYGGQVPALVAFDEDGTILGVTFTENTETVGLGQKVREPDFYTQFAGRPDESLSLNDIDKIASATISTNAAISAVNAAIDAYHQQTGGGDGYATYATLEEALPNLLPGEALRPITIEGDNVQPTAYVSDAGNFIIVGEKESYGGKPVVAAVAMSAEGEILNLWLDTSGEGEGYGQTLATNRGFIDGFIGQTAPAEVDAIADITSSSNAVMSAVNRALGALTLAKGAV